MNKNTQLICAHSALIFAALMAIGIFGITGWLPPRDPDLMSADIAVIFQSHAVRIRLGISVLAFASVFWWPFSAAIAMQMKRIEGASHPLTYVQMASASGTVMAILIACYLWFAAAYRPDTTPPGTIQSLDDLAWMCFVGLYPPAFLQNLSIGICILNDKRGLGVFPRWLAFANFWIAILFVPGAAIPFFKTGPFAWNGLIAFWLVAVCFFGWIIMMWWATTRAIAREPQSASND